MNSLEAKKILTLYRPETAEAAEPDFEEAIRQTRHDPELKKWFEQLCAFQTALGKKFRQIDVPEDLKQQILAKEKIIQPIVWWRNPSWFAAAAAILLLISLAAFWLKPEPPDRFSNFRERMVRVALREYKMDLLTNDSAQIRQFLTARGAPGDYVLTSGLEQLRVIGCGPLVWRSNPVSMICFDRGDQQMVFLFVVNRAAMKGAPDMTPEFVKVNKLGTASWSQGDKTYILAGSAEPKVLQKFL